MPGENDKTVRLQFVVDQASVQAAKKAMGELIVEATKLANVLKSASLGGAGGSVLGGGSVSAGSPNSQQTISRNAASGPQAGISAGVTEASKAIVTLGRNTKDAFQGVTQDVRRHLSDQGRDVDTFSRKVTALNRELTALRQNTAGGGGGFLGGRGGGGPGGVGGAGLVDQFGRAIGGGGGLPGGTTAAIAAGGGAPPGGTTAAVDAAAGGGGGGGKGFFMGMPGPLGSLMKGALTYLAVQQGLRMAGQVSGMLGTEGETYHANLAAGRGQAWGGMYRRAYGGDATAGYEALAMSGRINDAGTQKFARMFQAVGGHGTADMTSEVLGDISSAMGMSPEAVRDALNSPERVNVFQQKAQAKILENFRQSAGLEMSTKISNFQSNIAQNMAFQSMTGTGGYYTKNVNGKLVRVGRDEFQGAAGQEVNQSGGEVADYGYVNTGMPLYDQARKANLLPEELAAGIQAARAGGSRGTGGLIAGGMAAMGAWTGLGGLAGQAAIGGQSADFLRGTIGFTRGGSGLSGAAAMNIGGAVAGGLFGGGYATSGLGVLRALQEGIGGGFTGEEGMLASRKAGAGLQAAGALWGGGIDPYQKSLNFLNAGTAFGHPGFATQGYLSTIFGQNPELAIDIVKGGAIPAGLAAAGVTREKVQDYLKMSGGSLAGRANMILGDKEQAAFHTKDLAAAGGDIKKLIAEKGLKGKAARRYIQETATGLAIGSGGAIDAFQAESLLDIEAGLATSGKNDKLKKGGVGRKGSADVDALMDQKKREMNQMIDINTNMGTILASFKTTETAAIGFGKMVSSLWMSAEDVVAVFDWVAEKVGKQFGIIDVGSDPEAARKAIHEREAKEKAAADTKASPSQNPNFAASAKNRMRGK